MHLPATDTSLTPPPAGSFMLLFRFSRFAGPHLHHAPLHHPDFLQPSSSNIIEQSLHSAGVSMLDASSMVPSSSSSSDYQLGGDMMSMYHHHPHDHYQDMGPYDYGGYTPDVVVPSEVKTEPSSSASSKNGKKQSAGQNGTGRVGKSRGRGIFPKQATNRLRQWLFQNLTVGIDWFIRSDFCSKFMFWLHSQKSLVSLSLSVIVITHCPKVSSHHLHLSLFLSSFYSYHLSLFSLGASHHKRSEYMEGSTHFEPHPSYSRRRILGMRIQRRRP